MPPVQESHTATSRTLDTLDFPSRRRLEQPISAANVAEALLTLKTASALSGLSLATLYRKAATDPTFPKLIKLGKRCTRLRAGELKVWLTAQGEGDHV